MTVFPFTVFYNLCNKCMYNFVQIYKSMFCLSRADILQVIVRSTFLMIKRFPFMDIAILVTIVFYLLFKPLFYNIAVAPIPSRNFYLKGNLKSLIQFIGLNLKTKQHKFIIRLKFNKKRNSLKPSQVYMKLPLKGELNQFNY